MLATDVPLNIHMGSPRIHLDFFKSGVPPGQGLHSWWTLVSVWPISEPEVRVPGILSVRSEVQTAGGSVLNRPPTLEFFLQAMQDVC